MIKVGGPKSFRLVPVTGLSFGWSSLLPGKRQEDFQKMMCSVGFCKKSAQDHGFWPFAWEENFFRRDSF